MDNHQHNSTENIKMAFWLNILFTLIELVGGVYTNSVAIMADALHDFGDSLSLGLSWFLEKVAQREQSPLFSYGYKRFSLLAALINALILITGSFIILSETIPRILKPESTNATGMVFIAIVGIIINAIGAIRLKKGKTINEKIISLHLFEDFFGWIAILTVSLIMMVTDIKILDPILSLIITIYIFWHVAKNLKNTIVVFLQGVPPSISIEKIETILSHIPNIIGVHDTHIWSLDGEHHIVTTHLIFKKNCSHTTIKDIKCVSKQVLGKFGIQHATIETEIENDACDIDHKLTDSIISDLTEKAPELTPSRGGATKL